MEQDDDMWNLYNLVTKGDFIQGKITRKVSLEKTLGTERKNLTVVIRVEEMEYDPESNIVRIKGKNASENKFIQVGQFQSMDIYSYSVVTIIKVLLPHRRNTGTKPTKKDSRWPLILPASQILLSL